MNKENKQLTDQELEDKIYQKYIGKYIDKEDEEIEEEIEEIVEEESEFSDSEIDEFVNELKTELISNHFKTNEKINTIAYKIAKNSKEYLDYNTYMWVMYAFAMKYKDQNSLDSMKYCFVRMRSVLDKMNGIGEFPKALTKVESSVLDEMNNIILENTSFVETERKNVKKRAIEMEIVMFMMMFFMMEFVFKAGLLTSILLSIVVVYITYKFTKFSLEKAFVDTLLANLQNDELEEVIVKFDLPVRNS